MSLLLSLSLLFTTGCACEDSDLDGVCDELDACEGDDAADADADGVCDALDLCEGDDASGDNDADGFCDDLDLCEGDDASGDSDSDGICDALDLCEGDDASGDNDADGACDDLDEDDDNDTVPDAQDIAPLDPTQCEDLDLDSCDDCSSGTYDTSNDGPDWNSDGQCDAVDPQPEGFAESQTVLGKIVTCDSVTDTPTYSECTNAQVEGLYFPNGITCGPTWSTENSRYTDHESFCLQITGSTQFEVYYTCASTTERVTLSGETWGNFDDNGYTESIRCYFPEVKK